MKKIIIAILIVFALFAAYSSKPDDKTCIIAAVRAVWGNKVPDEKKPMYFNQFMDVTSEFVKVNDLVFLKMIRYRFNKDYKVLGVGAFKRVYIF